MKTIGNKAQLLEFNGALKNVEKRKIQGATVFLRVMSGAQRESYESFVIGKQDGAGKMTDFKGVRALLVSLTLCDESGEPLGLTAEEVNELNGGFVEELFDAAQEVNKLGAAGIEAAEKN